MSQIAADAFQRQLDAVANHPAMSDDNINVKGGTLDKPSRILIGIGCVGLILTVAFSFIFNTKHALASYEVGVFAVTAFSLGGMFWTMVFHLVNAGWTGTVRRQLENLMMMLPVCIALIALIVIVEVAFDGVLLSWMGKDPASDHLLDVKKGFLNKPFFVIRFAIYACFWLFLATNLWRNSRTQDDTGDRMLTRKSRFMSAWGLPLFALSISFFAFDFLMAMDYRFFSTMWGVYFFASCALGSIAVTLLVLCILRSLGLLTGLVTKEHTHDLGKLLFGFTVFWAYIGFSQYFLIWYANIPEETAWYVNRNVDGWENVSALLVIGHFIIPFLILLFRDVKRHVAGAAILATWIILMVVLDFLWIVRPMVYVGEMAEADPASWILDIAAIVGVLGIWFGLLLRRIAKGPLVAKNDPKMPEALRHRNYV